MKKNILIIGANKGLGKNILKLYLLKKHNVFYTSRLKKKIDKKHIFLDLLNLKDLNKLNLPKIRFTHVLFIAALTPNYNKKKEINSYFGSLSESEFIKYNQVNCFSPLKIFEHLIKKNYLSHNSKIIFFSSIASSITLRGKFKHNKKKGNLLYRLSKSSLNCAVKNLSYDFNNSKKIIISLHPGWVKTKSGGANAHLEIDEASKLIINLIDNLKKKDSGKFLDLYGKEIKW